VRVVQERLAEIAEHGPSSLRGVAHAYVGLALSNAGRLVDAQRHLQAAITLQPRADVLLVLNEATLVLAYLSLVSVQLGELDRADEQIKRALAESEADSVMGRAHILRVAAMVEAMQGRPARALALSEGLVKMQAKYDLLGFTSSARIIRAWATAMRRPTRRCVVEIRRALVERDERGERSEAPFYLMLLAEVYLRGGQPDGAVAATGEALSQLQSSGGHLCEAELHRLHGEALLARRRRRRSASRRQQDDQLGSEAELSFRRALEVASEQGARLWGLRTAVSLARLLRDRGSHAEARDLMAAACTSLGDRSQSVDVAAANRLLLELDRHTARRA